MEKTCPLSQGVSAWAGEEHRQAHRHGWLRSGLGMELIEAPSAGQGPISWTPYRTHTRTLSPQAKAAEQALCAWG